MVLVLHYFSFVTIVLWFLCFSFLSLGFALHYIHAFHSRCFFLFNIKKKGGKKGKKKEAHYCSCTILFVFENKVGQFIFT